MTGKQQGVLWGGLLLVFLRMWSTGQWAMIWGTASQPNYSSPGSNAPLLTPSAPPSGSGGGGTPKAA